MNIKMYWDMLDIHLVSPFITSRKEKVEHWCYLLIGNTLELQENYVVSFKRSLKNYSVFSSQIFFFTFLLNNEKTRDWEMEGKRYVSYSE